ncbi:hypothetical protein Tco_0431645 [Tanacetum coccineum]
MCLGDNVIEISIDKIKGSGDWNSSEYQDTASSKGKKVMNAFSFYKMETNEISERYIAPCFVNGLEAYGGEISLAFDENLISNEFTIKLCLDYEMKKGKKLVKKELIVALKGELYFVKFIINPEEDDFEPGVILGRSFLRLAKGVVDFGNGVITIYPEPDPFEDDYEKIGKILDYWDQLLDFNFDDVPKFEEELPPFICKIGKSNRNKKRAMENLNIFYQDIGPSSSVGGHLTQKVAAKEALAIRISQKFYLLEEERPIGKIVKEDEEAVKKIKGEALKEKDDPGAFIFPIRLEGKAARFDVLRTAESDSDDEEEYVIKRNKFGAPIYGSKPAPYLNFSFLGSLPIPLKQVNWKPDYKDSYTKEEEATRQWRTEIRLTDPLWETNDDIRPGSTNPNLKNMKLESIASIKFITHRVRAEEGLNRGCKV